MVNLEAEEPEMDQERILPGVVNTQAHFDKLEREKKAREEDATRVI